MPTNDTLRARRLRNRPTNAELRLWQHLRKRQLHEKFRRQVPIGSFVVDFVCLRAYLVIEVDGGQHMRDVSFDRKRDAYLNRRGFRVLRFWNHEVLGDIESVLLVIDAALRKGSSP